METPRRRNRASVQSTASEGHHVQATLSTYSEASSKKTVLFDTACMVQQIATPSGSVCPSSPRSSGLSCTSMEVSDPQPLEVDLMDSLTPPQPSSAVGSFDVSVPGAFPKIGAAPMASRESDATLQAPDPQQGEELLNMQCELLPVPLQFNTQLSSQQQPQQNGSLIQGTLGDPEDARENLQHLFHQVYDKIVVCKSQLQQGVSAPGHERLSGKDAPTETVGLTESVCNV